MFTSAKSLFYKRLGVGVFIIALLGYALTEASNTIVVVLAATLFAYASWELGRLIERRNGRHILYPGACILAAILPGIMLTSGYILTLCIAAGLWWVMWTLVAAFYSHSIRYSPFVLWIARLHCIISIPICFTLSIFLYQNHPPLLFYIISITILFDTFCYLGGSYFKGRKLAPLLSPGKTWSGLWSGMATVFILGIGAAVFFIQNTPTLWDYFAWAIISLLTAFFALVGDLSISVLKRYANVKNCGSILPGHGGILDRLDSFLAAIPIFLLMRLIYNTNI